jgi:hypothetical protein
MIYNIESDVEVNDQFGLTVDGPDWNVVLDIGPIDEDYNGHHCSVRTDIVLCPLERQAAGRGRKYPQGFKIYAGNTSVGTKEQGRTAAVCAH